MSYFQWPPLLNILINFISPSNIAVQDQRAFQSAGDQFCFADKSVNGKYVDQFKNYN